MIWVLKIMAFLNNNYKVLYLIYRTLGLLYKFLKNNNMEGLWSTKAEKGFGKFVDDKLSLPAWAEMFDGLVASKGIGWLDDAYSGKLPEVFTAAYIKVGKGFESYEDNGSVKLEDFVSYADVAVIIDGLVDIPKVTDEAEAILFAGILKGLFDVVGNYIKKTEL